MSPLQRKKLSKIRSELDKLDNALIKVIKRRTSLVKKVLALKEKKSEIIDQRRIKTILNERIDNFKSIVIGRVFCWGSDVSVPGSAQEGLHFLAVQ